MKLAAMFVGLRGVFAVLGRWLVRWLEMLGQNPPLGRDCGIGSWHYLHLRQVQEETLCPRDSERGIAPLRRMDGLADEPVDRP